MQKKKNKKWLTLIIALVMFLSPVFAGCSGGSGGASGGSGGSTGLNNNNNNAATYRNEISSDDYDDYFKNYRITYKPGSNQRQDFNAQIVSQTQDAAADILNELKIQYDGSRDEDKPLFGLQNDYSLTYVTITVNSTEYFLAYLSGYSSGTVVFEDAAYKYFSHKDAIDNWAISDENRIKSCLTIAQILILSGHNVVDNVENLDADVNKSQSVNRNNNSSFETLYNQYCTEFIGTDGKIKSDKESQLNALANSINHLGYTDAEAMQLRYFVLNYIVGKDLVTEDNGRFVNCYYDQNTNMVKKDTSIQPVPVQNMAKEGWKPKEMINNASYTLLL